MEPNIHHHTWDKLEGESAQAYRAFTAYRDLRADRSLDAAYRSVTGQQESSKRASGRFTGWSGQFDWKQRAEAYDAHLERTVRAETESSFIENHQRALGAFMERQRTVSAAATNVATGLLIRSGEALQHLKPATLKPGQLASLIRAAASVAEAASNAEAMALAVDELLRDLENRQRCSA